MPRPFFRSLAQTTALVSVLGFAVFIPAGPTQGSPAQAGTQTGFVEIAVVDPPGGAIPAAKIEIRHHPDGALQTFTTDAAGRVTVTLQPGKYRLIVSALAFHSETKEITVEAGSRQSVSVVLTVGHGSHVEVEAAYAAQIAAETGTLEFEVKDTVGGWVDGARFDFRVMPDGPTLSPSVADFGRLTVQLSRGAYEVKIAQPGFKDLVSRIDVRGGTTESFDVVMKVADDCPPGVICDPVQLFSGQSVTILEPESARMPELVGGCSEHEKIAEIRPSDRTYGYARELERSLDDRGIMVRCVCASKLTEIFRGQAGAAWFRTDDGAFDVLFMPKGRTFSGVRVVQRREGGAYRTSFMGKPQSAVRFDGSAPTYYFKRGNLLFSVGSDEKLAALLESKLPK